MNQGRLSLFSQVQLFLWLESKFPQIDFFQGQFGNTIKGIHFAITINGKQLVQDFKINTPNEVAKDISRHVKEIKNEEGEFTLGEILRKAIIRKGSKISVFYALEFVTSAYKVFSSLVPDFIFSDVSLILSENLKGSVVGKVTIQTIYGKEISFKYDEKERDFSRTEFNFLVVLIRHNSLFNKRKIRQIPSIKAKELFELWCHQGWFKGDGHKYSPEQFKAELDKFKGRINKKIMAKLKLNLTDSDFLMVNRMMKKSNLKVGKARIGHLIIGEQKSFFLTCIKPCKIENHQLITLK